MAEELHNHLHLLVHGAHFSPLLIAEDRCVNGPNDTVLLKLIWGAHIAHYIPVCRVDHLDFRIHNLQFKQQETLLA